MRPRAPGRLPRVCAPARGDAADSGRGFWAVSLRDGAVFSACSEPSCAALRVSPRLHGAGVFLNVGIVSSCRVGERSHIHSSSRCGAAASVFLCIASDPGRPELPEGLPCESGHWRSSPNPGQSEWPRPPRRGERTVVCAGLWPGRPRLLPAWRKSAAENYRTVHESLRQMV